MQLTDARIKALKPRLKRYLVSDGEGLSLDVLPSGRMSWFYRYRQNGRQEKVTLGLYPTMSLKAARNARMEKAAQVMSGKSPAMEKRLARVGLASNPTLREFSDRYYREQVVNRWKDSSDVRRYLDNEIYPTLGDKLLRDITVPDVQALVYRKRDSGRVAAAIQLRRIIKQIFDYALEVQLVTLNPAAMVATRYIGKASKRSRVLTRRKFACISIPSTGATFAASSSWRCISSC